jgi:hypothetical protein
MLCLFLAACGQSASYNAFNPLKSGLWRTTTRQDLTRTGAKPQHLQTVSAFVCAAAKQRGPAGPGLGVRKGCTGQVTMNSEDGVWSFTETCTGANPSAGRGAVWGDYQRSYVIERDISAPDPENPSRTVSLHEVVEGRWVRGDCPPDMVK